jgi:hypothetical protein
MQAFCEMGPLDSGNIAGHALHFPGPFFQMYQCDRLLKAAMWNLGASSYLNGGTAADYLVSASSIFDKTRK